VRETVAPRRHPFRVCDEGNQEKRMNAPKARSGDAADHNRPYHRHGVGQVSLWQVRQVRIDVEAARDA
jgi:hypothetical protein